MATYLAPEMAREGMSYATEKSDVWPFGCILLLILLSNYNGHTTMKDFQIERQKRNKGISGEETDCFYERKQTIDKESERVNLEVTKHINWLINHCADGGDEMTKSCLAYTVVSIY